MLLREKELRPNCPWLKGVEQRDFCHCGDILKSQKFSSSNISTTYQSTYVVVKDIEDGGINKT